MSHDLAPLNQRVVLLLAAHLHGRHGAEAIGARIGYSDGDGYFYDTGTETYQDFEVTGWRDVPVEVE